MSKNRGKRFIELLNKREKLEGTKIFGILDRLGISLYTEKRNYQDLSSAISKYESDISIWYLKNRPKLDAFLREFSRLLHNYLSSIYSLIEHTQMVRKNLDNSELNEDYPLKLEEIFSKDCVRFVRDLRTYSQHIGLPIIAARLSIKKKSPKNKRVDEKQQILLEKEALLKYKKWHRDSKKYIISHKDIDLKVALGEYQVLVEKFYEWFYKKVWKLYSKELEEFARIEAELAEVAP